MPEFETRLTQEMIETYTGSGDWGSKTFFDLLAERADAHPDREALYDRGRRITYAELRDRIDRVAARLQGLGIGRGDVVTIQLPNWIAFACVFFAVERVGGIANQINPDFRSAEVDYILRFSESAAYVCPGSFRDFDYLEMIADLRPNLPDLRHVCCAEGAGGPDVVSLAGAIEGGETPAPLHPVRTGANEVFRMAFTSGTTGNPKAVLHSHNTTLPTAIYKNEDLAIAGDDVILIYLPLGLNWGYLALLQTLLAGARAVLLNRFSARRRLAAHRRGAGHVHPDRAGLDHRHAERPRAGELRSVLGQDRDERRGVLSAGNHPRVPGQDEGRLHRALQHVGNRLPHLIRGPAKTRRWSAARAGSPRNRLA